MNHSDFLSFLYTFIHLNVSQIFGYIDCIITFYLLNYFAILYYYIYLSHLCIYKINNKYIYLYMFYEELAQVIMEVEKFYDTLSVAGDPGKLVV